jgi:SAM-dependent methyltransferase
MTMTMTAAIAASPPSISTPRGCPVCAADRPSSLYDNAMASIDRYCFSYPVVACENCGAVYAARALAPDAMGDYYRELSKYSHDEVSAFDQHRLRLAARFVRSLCSERGKLLDVGCSTGAFLVEAVLAGMQSVAGIEPSPAAVAIARARHGFDVEVGEAESFAGYRSFDVVSLFAVLEHLREPARFFHGLARELKPGALLVVEVPDADAFAAYDDIGVITEPFGEFSLEHINFFGVDALERLGASAGLKLVASETNRLLSGAFARLAAFRKEHAAIQQGQSGPTTRASDSVLRYVARSSEAMMDVDHRLAALAQRGTPIIVYGAGSHTARLMMRDAFAALRVALIVDRNVNLTGRLMNGVTIALPAQIAAFQNLPVLVSSFNASEQIAHELRDRFPNEVVCLYAAHRHFS